MPEPTSLASPAALAGAIADLHARAKAQGSLVAVIGGIAMQRYGSPRLTGDVDVIARTRLGLVGTPLTLGGISTSIRVSDPITPDIATDVIVPDEAEALSNEDAELYREALTTAQTDRTTGFRYVRPEFLIAMKMSAMRDKDGADVEWLLAYEKVDMKLADQIVREHLGRHAGKLLQDTAQTAVWKKIRGKL